MGWNEYRSKARGKGEFKADVPLHWPGRVAIAALAMLLLLVALNFLAIDVMHSIHGHFAKQVARMFILDEEANFPTLFNFVLLVGNAMLLTRIGLGALATGDRWWRHWMGLGVIFVYMSYDEAAQMHEQLMPIFDRLVQADGVLYFSWVIPGALFFLAVGLAYARFVFALPRTIMVLTILGGALYVSGALGTELIGGDYASRFGMETRAYLLIASVEETLEMLGLIVFGYGLMGFIATTRAGESY